MTQKKIREEFNKAFPPPMLLGQNQEKVADWWLSKLDFLLSSERARLRKAMKKKMVNRDTPVTFITDREIEKTSRASLVRMGYNQAIEDIKSLLTKQL